MAQAAQARHVPIKYARRWQAGRQVLLVELGNTTRTWHRSYIHQLPDAMRFEDADEIFDRMRRVADGADRDLPLRRHATSTTEGAPAAAPRSLSAPHREIRITGMPRPCASCNHHACPASP